MTTEQYITERTNGALSLVNDYPSSTTLLSVNEYFCIMFCTDYQSSLRIYRQYKGFSNYNRDLDLYDIDINKSGFDFGYYVSKDYFVLNKLFQQTGSDRSRILVVSVNDSSAIILLGADLKPLSDPIAIDATDITDTSFTINWNSVEGALGYCIDLSVDRLFSTFIPGYNNRDVLNILSINKTGLAVGITYYYRVSAYSNDQLSNNSNTITVKTYSIHNSTDTIVSSGNIIYRKGIRDLTLRYFIDYSSDNGSTWDYDIVSLNYDEDNVVIGIDVGIAGYRHLIRNGFYVIDHELTPTGFAGIQNIDWDNVYELKPE